MASLNILSENSQSERIADASLLARVDDLLARVARLEAQIAPRICCGCDRPEDCGDLDCPDARHYDALERLNAELLADADPFGIGPAGPVPSLSEAFDFPPPPHIGQRRADTLIDQVARHTLSYADHARNWVSFDGGAA